MIINKNYGDSIDDAGSGGNFTLRDSSTTQNAYTNSFSKNIEARGNTTSLQVPRTNSISRKPKASGLQKQNSTSYNPLKT